MWCLSYSHGSLLNAVELLQLLKKLVFCESVQCVVMMAGICDLFKHVHFRLIPVAPAERTMHNCYWATHGCNKKKRAVREGQRGGGKAREGAPCVDIMQANVRVCSLLLNVLEPNHVGEQNQQLGDLVCEPNLCKTIMETVTDMLGCAGSNVEHCRCEKGSESTQPRRGNAVKDSLPHRSVRALS